MGSTPQASLFDPPPPRRPEGLSRRRPPRPLSPGYLTLAQVVALVGLPQGVIESKMAAGRFPRSVSPHKPIWHEATVREWSSQYGPQAHLEK